MRPKAERKVLIAPDKGIDVAAPSGDEEFSVGDRRCIVTRTATSTDTMIRFVLSGDSEAIADLAGKLPGRGAWVTCSATCIDEAVKRGAFSRAFKKPVKVAPDLAARIEALLLNRALEALALANKAGLVIAGFNKVETRLREKPVATLIHATEAGADGRRKLDTLLGRQPNESRGMLIDKVFASAQLDLALGRTNVVHAALSHGGSAAMFIQRCRRFMSFCGGKPNPFDVLGEASGGLSVE